MPDCPKCRRANSPNRAACYHCGTAMHPQEQLLRAARRTQASPAGQAALADRQVAEHRLARLGQLGIGQARYVGRKKTRFQLLLAATVANLRRTWNWERSRSTEARAAQAQLAATAGSAALAGAFQGISSTSSRRCGWRQFLGAALHWTARCLLSGRPARLKPAFRPHF